MNFLFLSYTHIIHAYIKEFLNNLFNNYKDSISSSVSSFLGYCHFENNTWGKGALEIEIVGGYKERDKSSHGPHRSS